MPKQFCIFLLIFLQACAESQVSRDAAHHIDTAYDNVVGGSKSWSASAGDIYQNTNQMQRGAIVGGAAGAVAGGLVSGVGLLPGAAGGAILGASLGAYIDSQTTTVDKIKNRGVQVVELGDQVLIVLPSVQIFNGFSAEINPHAYGTLNDVATLIRGYTKMTVKVATYTDDLGSQRINYALSQEQAQSIMHYLWSAGVDTRLLYAQGYGGTHLVQPSNIDWGRGANYRVEITLQQMPV